MPKYDKYYAKWMANIAKCSKYHAKCKVTMPKCSKYHAKWQVLVPNCCKYKANGTGKENKNPYTKPEAKKIKNYSTPEDRGAGSRHFFARETTGQDTAWKEPRGSQRAAARVGFVRCDTIGDGNCQFVALAFSSDKGVDHHSLRTQIVEQLREKHNMFADKFDTKFGDFNAYLEYMAHDGSWGDECTLECAAHLFQRPIQVICPDPEHDRLFLPPESAPDDSLDADLVLAFVAWGHYEATVPLANEGTCAASTADEGPLAPHGGPPSHSNSAVAPGAPKAARRRRLPASFQSSCNFDASRFYRQTWACFKGLSKVYIGRRFS